jgi:hypothetical protein
LLNFDVQQSCPDGNLDVVSEANYVTIAYNKFYYTAAWKPLPDENLCQPPLLEFGG